MERLIILVGRPNKSVAPTKYFFKVPQVGRFIPLVGVIRRPVDREKKCACVAGVLNQNNLYFG